MNYALTPSVPYLIFDFANEKNVVERRIFSDPLKIITANSIDEVYSVLAVIQHYVNQGYYAAGFLSYEASPAFDSAYEVAEQEKLPLVWFGIFSNFSDHLDGPIDKSFDFSPWVPGTSAEDYAEHFKDIKSALSQGDTYQVNYTMKLQSRFVGDDLSCYHSLKEAQQARYGAYLNMGRFRILSFSPELFFRLDQSYVTTRPMKGTVKRGNWVEQDDELAIWLRNSAKNRAENVMIVDLLRNDLSKIAGAYDVRVPHLCEIERYPSVFQMTSTVTARVPLETTFVNVFEALFPCGSITGAPKISTMRLIKRLEQRPREIYCGTIGFIEPGGKATFNVAIRSVLLDKETGSAEYGVGGGVTFDSTVEGEYEEALLKAAFLNARTVPFDLLETLKLECGEYVLLDRHVQRLLSSADYFDIHVDRTVIFQRLHEHAALFPNSIRRVRLLVSQNGEAHVESAEFQALPDQMRSVTMAGSPIFKADWTLYHKTTCRDVYALHKSRHPSAFDVLLWNEEDQITEFTTGNIVLEMGRDLWTPARDSGLLAGTFRSHLLDKGIIREKYLTRADVKLASKIWFINSVHGWVLVNVLE